MLVRRLLKTMSMAIPSVGDTLRHPPGRPGLRPHIRLLRGSRLSMATNDLLPAQQTRCPLAGQDLLLKRTVHSRREVALRGPFCLRLASASQDSRISRDELRGSCLAQPRTRTGAMTERYPYLGRLSVGKRPRKKTDSSLQVAFGSLISYNGQVEFL